MGRGGALPVGAGARKRGGAHEGDLWGTKDCLASPLDMSELQISGPNTLASSEPRLGGRRLAPASLHTCLVVSTAPQRTQLFVRAAQQEHWATIVCRTADEAARQAVRSRVHLALVDLQYVPAAQEPAFRALVEQLSARDGPLVAVCGKPNDTLGEVWSRQLGVWMYLPGVDRESDVALLYSEARGIVEKLNGNVREHAK